MLRIYTRFVGNGIRNTQLNHMPQQLQSVTQFARNFSDGNYDCEIHLKFAQQSINIANVFSIYIEQRKKFSISDEVIDGRPLYLDAQATTPLVRRYLSF